MKVAHGVSVNADEVFKRELNTHDDTVNAIVFFTSLILFTNIVTGMAVAYMVH